MSIYREYRNPLAEESRLNEMKRELDEYKASHEFSEDDETLIQMQIDIHEQEEQVNFAWQDEYQED